MNQSIEDGAPYYLTAAEVAARLGVTRATVYAYVSRGWLRSEPVPGRPRERRYVRADVERLRERRVVRRDPAAAAARGLTWGGPVLESAVTLVDDGAFYYRGHDAVALAATRSIEQVASLLWQADEEGAALFRQPLAVTRRQLGRLRRAASDAAIRWQAALPVAGAFDLAAYDRRGPAVGRTGARIVRLMTALVADPEPETPIHRALAAAWAPRRPAAAAAIRTALVLCADHELNASTFAVRCAAAAGASPYDVASVGLATLKGDRHGGAAARVAALLARADTDARARETMADALRLGTDVPGFGHPLYPRGDPRADALLSLAAREARPAVARRIRHLRRAGLTVLRDRPNLDFGLAAMAAAYGLPPDAPLQLFGLGRTVGWMAHAMEEYAANRLIRPRARYTGPPPEAASSHSGRRHSPNAR